ncbi:MAG: phosphoglucosamine mutase [Actinomycetota bacterium]
MGRLFGTDGVRGVAGLDLTPELARDLGRAAVAVLGRHGDARPSILIGRDTRRSGVWLETALVEGIRSAGGDAVVAGVEPTPAIAFLIVELGTSAGAVISASHNPPEDNGIKFFDGSGMKLPDELEDEIELAMTERPEAPSAGRMVEPAAGRERYLEHLIAAAEGRLDGLRVVVDCANGAASGSAPELLSRLGADVHAIHDRPDGVNINVGCGALHPGVVAAEVVRIGADAGVAHDGDADRAVFADAEGNVVDGDQVLAACALHMDRAGRLDGHRVVTTVMSNLGFHRAMREAGIEVAVTQVGDRYVLEEMLRSGAKLGGEQSGHVIFREHATTGDGLLTAVRFLSLAVADATSVAGLASCMRRFPQVTVNVPVRDRQGLADADGVWAAVRRAEEGFAGAGRVLVRASGTEPLVRVMVEAEDGAAAEREADAIAGAVAAALGAA